MAEDTRDLRALADRMAYGHHQVDSLERAFQDIRESALEEAARAAEPTTDNGSSFNDGRRAAAAAIRALKGEP